jgi:hypothetical protein
MQNQLLSTMTGTGNGSFSVNITTPIGITMLAFAKEDICCCYYYTFSIKLMRMSFKGYSV